MKLEINICKTNPDNFYQQSALIKKALISILPKKFKQNTTKKFVSFIII